MATRITKSLTRIVLGAGVDYVVQLEPLGLTLRPKRVRDPSAKVTVLWDQVYRWGMIARVEREREAKADNKKRRTKRVRRSAV